MKIDAKISDLDPNCSRGACNIRKIVTVNRNRTSEEVVLEILEFLQKFNIIMY